MEIKDFQEQQKTIRREIRRTIVDDGIRLKQLSDGLVESATNIQGQGYMEFVRFRENFLAEIDRMSESYCVLVCPDYDDVARRV